jgi:hypothetical protein
MPGQVIGTSLSKGYPGSIARGGSVPYISNRAVKASTADIAFGDPVVLDTTAPGTWVKFAGSVPGPANAAADFAGVAVRTVKQATAYQAYPAVAVYTAGEPCDVVMTGRVMVQCNYGTPAIDGTVYVRITANGANTIISGFEATADGGNSLALTNAKWASGPDANGVAELDIMSRLHV